jgi:hypothetical protein
LKNIDPKNVEMLGQHFLKNIEKMLVCLFGKRLITILKNVENLLVQHFKINVD